MEPKAKKLVTLTVGGSSPADVKRFIAFFRYCLEAHGADVSFIDETDAIGKHYRTLIKDSLKQTDLAGYEIHVGESKRGTVKNGNREGVEVRRPEGAKLP